MYQRTCHYLHTVAIHMGLCKLEQLLVYCTFAYTDTGRDARFTPYSCNTRSPHHMSLYETSSILLLSLLFRGQLCQSHPTEVLRLGM